MTISSGSIEAKIAQTAERFAMLPEGGAVVAGVSGGADSMALLFYLLKIAPERGISVCAAHLNHGLRGEEAERDEDFVRSYCAAHGVECRVRRADVRAEAARTGQSEETCGRSLRYAFFAELAQERGARIATAHTLSDNVETVLLNLARGTGLSGLCGIPPVRDGIVRPLLFLTRAQTEAYCRENGVPFVTDSTNLTPAYARNRLRLEAVPALKSVNSSLEEAVLRMTGTLSEEEAFLSSEAERALAAARRDGGYDLHALAGLPAPLLRRAVKSAAGPFSSGQVEKVHVELLCRAVREGHGGTALPGGRILAAQGGLLREPPGEEDFPEWSVPFAPPLALTGDGRRLIIEAIDGETYGKRLKINNLLFKNAVAYDTITGSTVLRNRRAGDRFFPASRGVGKSLKKLFQEEGVPAHRRGNVPLLADGGEILWVEGVGPSERARVRADTERVALILPEEKNNG